MVRPEKVLHERLEHMLMVSWLQKKHISVFYINTNMGPNRLPCIDERHTVTCFATTLILSLMAGSEIIESDLKC